MIMRLWQISKFRHNKFHGLQFRVSIRERFQKKKRKGHGNDIRVTKHMAQMMNLNFKGFNSFWESGKRISLCQQKSYKIYWKRLFVWNLLWFMKYFRRKNSPLKKEIFRWNISRLPKSIYTWITIKACKCTKTCILPQHY